MTKTATVRARIDPSVKERAEAILRKIGITPSEAISVFYHRVAADKAVPFSLRVPNAKTRAALRSAERGDGRAYHSVNELFESTLGKKWHAKRPR